MTNIGCCLVPGFERDTESEHHFRQEVLNDVRHTAEVGRRKREAGGERNESNGLIRERANTELFFKHELSWGERALRSQRAMLGP